ncbi:metallophosphoesterase [Roseivirga sp. BDSF3-8]|uniref:metallophosphoesterase n=1 Tax=Roseivirga sp. BDSF3-8 TaxID=3241598 RepID=UPI003531EF71
MRFSKGLKWIAGLAGLATGYILVDSLLLERFFFKIRTFHIGNKQGRKPPIRIIHLTDLHLRREISVFHQHLADKLNELRPDLFLLTGDSIDQNGKPSPFEVFMRLLDGNIPKYGIMGNHEYKAKIPEETMQEIFRMTGGRLLVDETETIEVKGSRLTLTGLDDIVKSNSNFTKAIEGVQKEDNHLLMVHSPLHYERMVKELQKVNQVRPEEEKLNIYCALAGHTHGGQVTLTGEPLVLPEKSGDYNRGWYSEQKPYLYVSKGFGVSGLPLRFGARAEITVLYYHPF